MLPSEAFPPNPTSPAQPLASIPVRRTQSYLRLRRTGRVGLLATLTAVLLIGGFIANTTIAGAVVTSGILVVDSGAKPVQHPGGGVVAEVLVRNGAEVSAGQPVLRLDTSALTAKLTSSAIQLAQQSAQLARLVAERDDLAQPQFDGVVEDASVTRAELDVILRTEQEQWRRRREELSGQLEQLDEQIAQSEADQRAYEAQLASTVEERDLIAGQLQNLRSLYDQQLVAYPRIAETELSLTQAKGNEGRLTSAIAVSKAKLAELKVTKIQISRTWRTDVAKQIADVQVSLTQLGEQVAISRDQMQRSTIRAPLDGIVHELAALTGGTVIQPGETLMLVVPDHDRLVGEVKIRPGDIDQVYPGQKVTLQFSAFERATTPSVHAHLSAISADLIEDPRSGLLYYTGRIEPEQMDILSSQGLKPVPGMPIEAFIRTEDRTIFSFLTKPLTDQANRAFR